MAVNSIILAVVSFRIIINITGLLLVVLLYL